MIIVGIISERGRLFNCFY